MVFVGYFITGGSFDVTPEDAAVSTIDGVKKAEKYKKPNCRNSNRSGRRRNPAADTKPGFSATCAE